MEALKRQGHEIVIFTVQCSPEFNGLSKAVWGRRTVEAWLKKHDIPFDHIWMEAGKPNADAFVDDKGVSCRPADNGKVAYGAALERIKQIT